MWNEEVQWRSPVAGFALTLLAGLGLLPRFHDRGMR
jgi:hypothetical protein